MMTQRLQTPMDWKQALRAARLERQMTQAELARRSGLSLAAIKSYEAGERRPKADNLKSILDSLGLALDEANRIFAAAGYAADADAIFNAGHRSMTLDELAARADSCRWAAFVTNRSFDVVYANEPMARLFEVDLTKDLLGFADRNLMAGITREDLAARLGNWDEVVRFMIGLAKGDPRWTPGDLSRPAPWLQAPLQRFMEGDPARVKRFFDLWESSAPIPHHLMQRYRIVWLYRRALRMNFAGMMYVANLSDELHWNEWVPADSETWRLMDELRQRGTLDVDGAAVHQAIVSSGDDSIAAG